MAPTIVSEEVAFLPAMLPRCVLMRESVSLSFEVSNAQAMPSVSLFLLPANPDAAFSAPSPAIMSAYVPPYFRPW